MKIAAGIVTYEPELDRLRANFEAIASQVDHVFVFDNGSSNVELIAALAAPFANMTIARGPENLGIAQGLNEVCELAERAGCDAIVTLDQDSVSTPGMVKALAEQFGADPRIGMATPYIVDRNKMTAEDFHELVLPVVEDFQQAARKGAITSGALLRLSTWREVGKFDARFFIDYVDYDLNQRLLNLKWRIVRANRAYLVHEVGHAKKTWLITPRRDVSGRLRLERFYSFGHSPMRCYYKARNRVLFSRKYGRKVAFRFEGFAQIPYQVILTLAFEDQKRAKLSAFARGIADGFRLPLRQPTLGIESEPE